MPNDDIGEINCSVTITGKIRRKKSGRYPLYVHSEQYGNLFFQTAEGQEFILSSCVMYDESGKPDPVEPPAAASTKKRDLPKEAQQGLPPEQKPAAPGKADNDDSGWLL